MSSDQKPHIHLTKSQLAEHKVDAVIVCGDPGRAAKIASFLTDSKPLAKNREYHSYVGTHQGKPVLVMSHGVGAPGAAICFQEMIDLGVNKIIRVGTAGALQRESKIAGLVIAQAAARKDGVTQAMVPSGYPAIGDLEICRALYERAKKETQVPQVECGIILTTDLFYPGILEDDLKIFSQAGVKAVEMEVSTLFTIASLRKIKSGAIVVLDGNPLFWSEGEYKPGSDEVKQSTDIAIRCALDVLVNDTH